MFKRFKARLFPTTIYEIEAQGRSSRLLAVLLIFVLILGGTVAALFLLKKSSRVKTWKSRHHAERAIEYADEGDLEKAVAEAAKAWPAGFGDPKTTRVLATLLTEHNPKEAVWFWNQLEQLIDLSQEDQRRYAICLSATGEEVEAKRRAGKLIESAPEEPENWRMAAELARHSNQLKDAVSHYQRLSDAGLTTTEDEWKWQTTLAADPNLYGHEQSIRDLIHNDVPTPGPKGLIALQLVLENPPSRDLSLMRTFLDKALSREDLELVRRMEIVRFEAQRYPHRRKEISDRELARHRELPPIRLAPLLEWLLEGRDWEAILALLKGNENRLGPAVRHYCTALLETGRTVELDRFLGKGETGLSSCLHSVYMAHSDRLKGAPAESLAEHLKVAFAAAQVDSDPQDLLVAAEYASSIGFDKLAAEGMLMAADLEDHNEWYRGGPGTKRQRETLMGYLALKGQALESQRTDWLLRAVSSLADREYLITVHEPQSLYLNLLIGERIEESYDLALAGYAKYPSDPRWGLALSLGYYRLGADPSEFAQEFNASEEFRYGERAILAVLKGRPPPWVGEDGGWVLPEELAFIQSQIPEWEPGILR